MTKHRRASTQQPVLLEKPSARRRDEFLQAARRSTGLHRNLASPARTDRAFDDYLKRVRRSNHAAFWIRTPDGRLAGAIHIGEIVRGSLRSGYLGYYAFAPHERRGYMTQGLREVLRIAFRELKLHRLEANIQPGNRPSKRLAQRVGFRKEGLSPRYLKIGGRWRDHERWALTIEDWASQRS